MSFKIKPQNTSEKPGDFCEGLNFTTTEFSAKILRWINIIITTIMIKIKLIYPPNLSDKRVTNTPPLGIAQLAGSLTSKGYKVDLEDLNALCEHKGIDVSIFSDNHTDKLESFISGSNSDIENVISEILRDFEYKSYDVLGFSIIGFYNFKIALVLAKKIKEENKNIVIVFGGSFITFYEHQLLDDFDFIDYVIFGMAEESFYNLITHLEGKNDVSCVDNLIHRTKTGIKRNKPKRFDLENSPLPVFDNFFSKDYCAYIKRIPYLVGVGCNNRCAFCTDCLVYPFAVKSPLKVVSDLKILSGRYKNNKVFLHCNNLHVGNYIEEFCDLLIKNKLNLNWGASLLLKNLSNNTLQKMKAAGNTHIATGIESASPRLLSKMNKRLCLEECEEILKNARQTKIDVRLNFIVGFPGESDTDFKYTVDFVKRNFQCITDIKVDSFGLIKKSMVAQHPERYGITKIWTPVNGLFAKYYPSYNFSETNISDDIRSKTVAERIRSLEKAVCNNNIRFFTRSL